MDAATESLEQSGDLHARVADAVIQICRSIWSDGRALCAQTNIVEYGLSSLATVRLRLGLKRAIGADLTMEEFARCKTIADVAQLAAPRAALSWSERSGARRAEAEAADAERVRASFPLSDIQQAYVLGKQAGAEYDEGGCYLYREIEVPQLDVVALRAAWQRVIDHQEALRIELGEYGRQRVREACTEWQMPVRSVAASAREAALAEQRARMGRQGFCEGEWPLFRVEVTHCHDGVSVVHLGIDGVLCDGTGLDLLLGAWARFYQEPATLVPATGCSVCAAMTELEELRSAPEYRRALDYWVESLEQCPEGPLLLAHDGAAERESKPSLSRPLSAVLSETEWLAFRRRAEGLGVSPTSLVLTLFSEALLRGDARAPFSLVLTTNYRPWLSRAGDAIVGPFTGSMLFVVDAGLDSTLEEAARRVHAKLWQALDHALVGSVAVLRELRRRRKPVPTRLPVVFTSMLDTQGRRPGEATFADRVSYASSRTPGVQLDHQMWSQDGALHIHWDVSGDGEIIAACETLFCRFVRSLRVCALSADAPPKVRALNELQKAYFVPRAEGELGLDAACQVYQQFRVRNLDLARLDGSVVESVEAYEVLRTVLGADSRAHVLAQGPKRFEIPVIDLQTLPDAHAYLQRLEVDMVTKPFPLGRWPMFDVRVTRDGSGEDQVHVCLDLAIADGVSLHEMVREVLARTVDSEAPPPHTPPPASEAYSLESGGGGSTAAATDYWRARFQELPPGPRLKPGSGPRKRVRLEATIRDASRLGALARSHGVARDMLLAAALAGVLERWLSQGPFTLPVVLWPSAAAKYRPCELTELTWVTCAASGESLWARAGSFMAQIAKDPPPGRGSGLAELRKYVMRRRRKGEFALPVVYTSTLDLTAHPLPAGVSMGPWMTYTPDVSLDCISLEEHDGALQIVWDAVETDFEPGQLQEMFSAYETSLRTLLSEQLSRDTILYEWNATGRPFVEDRPCQYLIEARVDAQPHAMAVRCGREYLSYSELDAIANRVAWQLLGLGVGPETVVGVALKRGPALVAIILGIVKAGAAYLPLDISWPTGRLATVLTEARAKILIADSHGAAHCEAKSEQPWTVLNVPDEASQIFRELRSDRPAEIQDANHAAYVIFTSGSTGTPKGIAVTHRSLLNLLAWAYRTFEFSPRDTGLMVASIGFDLSVFDIFGLLGAGACLCLATEEQQQDPDLLLDLLVQEKITFWNSAPAVLHQMAPRFSRVRAEDSQHLRLVFLSGDYMPLSLPQDVNRAFPRALLVNLGGATEATVWSNYYVVKGVDPAWRSIPYGKPIDNCRYYVLDEQMEPCPVGVEGDLYIAGVPVSRGYLHRPDLTAKQFLRDPFTREPGERMYRTGDRACYYPDGNLSFLGRCDHQVKIRGYRVELAEIEHRIRTLPGIKDVVVSVRVDHTGDQKLIAWVIGATAAALPPKEIRAHVAQSLPDYMVPNFIVPIAELPKTANGKLDRDALPLPSQPQGPARNDTKKVPTRDEISSVVASLFAEALANPKLDPQEDLWEQGATSFNMVQVSGGLQRRFGCRVPVAALVQDATIVGISRFLEQRLGDGAGTPAPVPAAASDRAPQPVPDESMAVDILDAPAVLRFKQQSLHLRAAGTEPRTSLPDDGNASELVASRVTHRDFSSTTLSLVQIGRLLSVLREVSRNGQARHVYASAGGTYAVQVYLHVKAERLQGLGAGIYYYDSRDHSLRRLSDGRSLEKTVHFQYNRAVYEEAAFGIFLIGQTRAIAPLYGEDAERFLLIEAGYMGQLLMMNQERTGLGLCPVGSLAFEKIRGDFALDAGHRFLHAFLGGAARGVGSKPAARPLAAMAQRDEVAIVGVAGRYASANSARALWNMLRDGKRGIGELPANRRSLLGHGQLAQRRVFGGFMPEVAQFDSLMFHVSPREAKELDPQTRLALEVTWEAIEDAGYTPDALRAGGRVGVFAAVMWHDYMHVGAEMWAGNGTGAVAGMASDLANRVSYVFGFDGPSVAINTSCSSSLTALHAARNSLQAGECEAAVVVAVNLIAHPYHLGLLEAHQLLAATAEPVAFDPASAGWLPGEGCGAVILRLASDAAAARDDVRVILESTWLGHSGRGQRFSAPSCAALERSIRGALQAANVVPRDIDYVECAAAGASLADVAEIEALEAVFGSDGERKLPIGTLKSNIGHLEAAAGMSQLTKVLLQLKASRFAPTLAAQVQHPLLHWSALHVQPVERCSEWQERADGTPRRALINAVGATGSYAHAVLREPARGPGRANGAKKQHFVLLSAASRAQLVVQAERLRQFVLEEPTVHLEDIAFTTQVGRVSLAHRLVIECRELDELPAGLAAFAKEQAFAGLRVSEVDPDAAQQFAPSSQSRAAECWLGGGKIDWAPLTGETARRIGLPTLAFAREHHWLPGADVDVQAGNGPQMEQYLLDVYAEISEIPRSRLRARTPLERYGLSSSIIGQLNQRLTRDLGEIPRTLFFEYPDLAGVAAFLAERFNVPGATPQQERSSPGASAVAEARSPCSAVPHASDAAEVDGRVAIIGLGGRYPGSSDLDSFCRTLLDGRDQIRQMPEERCAPDWPRELMWGSFLDHVDAFDPLFFQITPRDAELMCPEERLFLQVAWETMEDGGYGRQRLQKEHKSRCGVFVGAMYNEYPFFGVERTLRGQRGYAGSAVAGIANRVSYFLDLRGPSMTVDTMCSASLTCLHLAVESLRRNECELALAGGVNLSLHANKFVQIEGMKMASSDHRCRAFGAGGDGFAPGEGVGAVLLKPLKRALADGDRIQAVVLGSAVNHGGRTNGYTVPNPAAQAEVVQEALKRAGVRPTTIGYIEAHGTGTELGDPIEIEGLQRAYTSNAEHVAAGAIAIGSLKSVLGHLEAAAGIAGVTKVVQQMRHGRFAPSLHADVLNPNVDWTRSPFRVQREAADWPQLRDAAGSLLPRRAAVSAFGAGGSNAHVVLEQLVLAPPERRTRPGARELIVLSARTPASLRAMAERLSAFVCRAEADTALEDIAFTLQVGRDAFRERLAIVAATRAELVEALARFTEGRGGVLDGRASDEPPVGSPPSEPEALARFWIAGGEVNWRALRGPTTARVIGLPTYPFAEMRCWLSEASTEPAPAVTLYEKAWCAAEQPPSSSMGIDGPVACVYGSGSEAIARAVARALGEDKVLLVREGSAWGPSHADATTWLDLGDLCAQSPKHEAWLTRLGWLQSWVARRAAGQRRLLHVTSGLYAPRSGGSVVGARMAAVVRSLSSEVHELSARTLDTDLPSERVTAIVDQILAELAIPEGASEVFYERGRRQVPELRQLLRPAREVRQLAPDKVYLVTGGTRGLGAKVAEHLVERGARRLALVCQGPFPSRREAWDDPAMPAAAQAAVKTVRELERRGASVALHARSLSDRPALDEFVRKVRRELGPIGGIVHCAGRASHGSPAFVRKTLDEIAATFEPKVDGLEALVDVCGRDEPEFFLLFSSVSAIVPTLAAGVLDYAAANAFMEIFAAHQSASRAGGLCSVAWPPWSESSVSDAARAACASVGLGCLETASALCALDTLIAQPAPARLLVLPPVAPGFDANSLLRAPPRARPAPLPAPPTVEKGRLDWLVELFSTELAIPVNELDQTAHFSDLGIESVMLAALVEKIEQRVSRPLDPSVLLEHPTLERLALHLASFAPRGASSSTSHDAHPRLDARSEATFRRPELPTGAIAVLGASARFPGARDEAGFWSNLLAGHCAVSEVPKTRWDTAQLYSPRHELGRSMSKWGGFVEGLEDFDPEYFRMTEDEARRCDPAIRLVMEGAVTGLGDAGYRLEDVRGSQTGVFVGARMSGYRRRAPVQQFAPMGGDQNFIGAHLAHFLDIHGPNLVVDSACSSALVAVKLACQALLAGEADLAIAGAVEVLLDEEPYLEFSAARALSPSGRCKTFDQHADGFVPGEGCGMVILKALPQAIRDGDRIRAVIRGIAVNNDGATMGLTTPNPAAQMDVVLRALRASGLDAASVQMLEAHGTATMIGDPIELRALTDAFRTATSRAGFCAIGSVKSNIGHLLSAAGIAGLIKAILAIEHGLIPPTLFCTTPNPRFDFEASPFFPNTRVRPWHADPGERIAGVSSFGLGGTNAHAILSGLASEVSAQRSVARSALPPPTWARRRCWLERPDSAPRAAPPRPAAPAFSARPPAPEASILNLEFIS